MGLLKRVNLSPKEVWRDSGVVGLWGGEVSGGTERAEGSRRGRGGGGEGRKGAQKALQTETRREGRGPPLTRDFEPWGRPEGRGRQWVKKGLGASSKKKKSSRVKKQGEVVLRGGFSGDYSQIAREHSMTREKTSRGRRREGGALSGGVKSGFSSENAQ